METRSRIQTGLGNDLFLPGVGIGIKERAVTALREERGRTAAKEHLTSLDPLQVMQLGLRHRAEFKAYREEIRRYREEQRRRTKYRLTKTGWFFLALAVLEFVYVAWSIYEHQRAHPQRSSAVQAEQVVGVGNHARGELQGDAR